MRVAIWVVSSSIFLAAASAGAASVVEASVSYPTAVSARNVAAAQDAIKPSAMQQRRDSAALLSKASGANPAASARIDALAFDRRLASLDPSQIVYEQSQSQPLAQAGLLDLSNARLFPRPEQRVQPRQQQHARSAGDFLLMGFAALMLIAYQLRKKHRILRPHPFSY
jgi:hypothetical protein